MKTMNKALLLFTLGLTPSIATIKSMTNSNKQTVENKSTVEKTNSHKVIYIVPLKNIEKFEDSHFDPIKTNSFKIINDKKPQSKVSLYFPETYSIKTYSNVILEFKKMTYDTSKNIPFNEIFNITRNQIEIERFNGSPFAIIEIVDSYDAIEDISNRSNTEVKAENLNQDIKTVVDLFVEKNLLYGYKLKNLNFNTIKLATDLQLDQNEKQVVENNNQSSDSNYNSDSEDEALEKSVTREEALEEFDELVKSNEYQKIKDEIEELEKENESDNELEIIEKKKTLEKMRLSVTNKHFPTSMPFITIEPFGEEADRRDFIEKLKSKPQYSMSKEKFSKWLESFKPDSFENNCNLNSILEKKASKKAQTAKQQPVKRKREKEKTSMIENNNQSSNSNSNSNSNSEKAESIEQPSKRQKTTAQEKQSTQATKEAGRAIIATVVENEEMLKKVKRGYLGFGSLSTCANILSNEEYNKLFADAEKTTNTVIQLFSAESATKKHKLIARLSVSLSKEDATDQGALKGKINELLKKLDTQEDSLIIKDSNPCIIIAILSFGNATNKDDISEENKALNKKIAKEYMKKVINNCKKFTR